MGWIISDEDWDSLLDSRGAQDETVGALSDWEYDILACEAGDLLRADWQVREDARAKAAAEAAWAARRAA